MRPVKKKPCIYQRHHHHYGTITHSENDASTKAEQLKELKDDVGQQKAGFACHGHDRDHDGDDDDEC